MKKAVFYAGPELTDVLEVEIDNVEAPTLNYNYYVTYVSKDDAELIRNQHDMADRFVKIDGVLYELEHNELYNPQYLNGRFRLRMRPC